MRPVCAITGGGSGMGLATAKIMGQTHQIMICGRTLPKLQAALAELKSLGIEAHAIACDVADQASVEEMAKTASSLGPVATVIHAAGISPQMGVAEDILRVNALGTIHIHNAFYPRLVEGGCLIDVGSLAGHMVHSLVLPTRAYRLSQHDPALFIKRLLGRTRWFPSVARSGFAYCISKNFVMWYVRAEAERFGQKGVRVLSVSPGSFDTDMGMLAKAGADRMIEFCAVRRFGHVDEIAQLLAFCTDKRLGYLTGVDILCDGGCLAGGLNNPFDWLHMQIALAAG